MEKLKVGIVGAGTMGELYGAVLSQHESSDLVCICDKDLDRARRLGRRHGVSDIYQDTEQMLGAADVDAVVVATPDFFHRELVLACLDAGKSVLCEKPLATTLEDCRAIVDAVEVSGKKLMVNYGNRHRPNARALKGILDEGRLGRIEYLYVRLNERIGKTRTLAWADKTSPIFFLLSHCVDLVQWLLDEEIGQVRGYTVDGILRKEGIETPDLAVFLGRTASGTVVNLESTWALPESYSPNIDFCLQIVGEEGACQVDLFPHDLNVYGESAQAFDYSFKGVDYAGTPAGWWGSSVRYFVSCVLQDELPRPTAEEGLSVTKTLLAMIASAES